MYELHLYKSSKISIDKSFPNYNKNLKNILINNAAILAAKIRKKKDENLVNFTFFGRGSRILAEILPNFSFFSSKKNIKKNNERNNDNNYGINNNTNNKNNLNNNNNRNPNKTYDNNTITPKKEEKEKEKEEEDEVCPICLNDLSTGPSKLLPCSHAIHTKCLRLLGRYL